MAGVQRENVYWYHLHFVKKNQSFENFEKKKRISFLNKIEFVWFVDENVEVSVALIKIYLNRSDPERGHATPIG